MQLHQLTIALTLTIAAAGTQSAAWSFTPNNLIHATPSAEYQLALQPTTSGVAASQSFNATPKDSAAYQQSTMPGQSNISTESANKSLNVNRYNPPGCQFVPQASGGSVLRQLDALSICNAGN